MTTCSGPGAAEAQPTLMPLLVPAREAARILGVSERTTRHLIYSGQLESVQIGTRRLVPVDALSEYVSRLRSQ